MPIFHPRLRFSLRTLFVLVTLLGFVGIWFGYQLNWIRERNEARRWLAANQHVYLRARDLVDSVMPTPAPWSLDLFGEEGAGVIWLNPSKEHPIDAQAKVAELRRLFPEANTIEAGREDNAKN